MENDAVQADLRDLRKSMDQKFDRQDARLASALEQLSARFKTQDERFDRLDERFERLDTKQMILLEKIDARFKTQDERFERQDTRQVTLLEKIDARFERQDERFERRDARLQAAVDGRLEAMSTRGLTVWVGAVTAAATIAAAVLANHLR